jgi:hypothetical protein
VSFFGKGLNKQCTDYQFIIIVGRSWGSPWAFKNPQIHLSGGSFEGTMGAVLR